MKKFSLGLTIGALVALALSSSVGQQPPRDLTKEKEELVQRHRDAMGPTGPRAFTPYSRQVKQISEDVAISLYTDRHGTRRATLIACD